MLSKKPEYQSIEAPELIFHVASTLPETDDLSADATLSTNLPSRFYGNFADCMEMYAPQVKVAEYLNAHPTWFHRCAHPMKVETLGENSYSMTIGRFGAFGYEVEPKVGLELFSSEPGVYRIKTIPVPDYVPLGYDVDFQASMCLSETPSLSSDEGWKASEDLSSGLTRVEWQLNLTVDIHFPKFINRLPKSMVQSTGDRILNQVVRQVSRRLTHKVQEDFHQALDLPFPPKSKRKKGSEGVGR